MEFVRSFQSKAKGQAVPYRRLCANVKNETSKTLDAIDPCPGAKLPAVTYTSGPMQGPWADAERDELARVQKQCGWELL